MTLSAEGFELSDGGTILYPEHDGRIVRVDYWGNSMESRNPEDADWEDWNNLMGDRKWEEEEE